MTRLLLTADWHLHGSASRNRPVRDALRELDRGRGPGDWLLVAGDVTDGGTEAEYAQALALLRPWAGRCLLAPGNHDCGPLGLLVGSGARSRWRKLVELLHAPAQAEVGGRLVQVLDSCLYSWLPTDLARGRLGDRQTKRARSAAATARTRGLHPMLLLHHWPWCTDGTLALDDGPAVQRLVAELGCELVAGHTHEAAGTGGAGWSARCLPDLRSVGRAEVMLG